MTYSALSALLLARWEQAMLSVWSQSSSPALSLETRYISCQAALNSTPLAWTPTPVPHPWARSNSWLKTRGFSSGTYWITLPCCYYWFILVTLLITYPPSFIVWTFCISLNRNWFAYRILAWIGRRKLLVEILELPGWYSAADSVCSAGQAVFTVDPNLRQAGAACLPLTANMQNCPWQFFGGAASAWN